jgi:transcriptional regulator with XRE-family HTH domain
MQNPILSLKVVKNIRSLRILKGYSQEYLATRINKSQNWLQKVECGEITLTLPLLDSLASALEMDATTLIIFDADQVIKHFQIRTDRTYTVLETKDLLSLATSLHEISLALIETSDNLKKALLESQSKL